MKTVATIKLKIPKHKFLLEMSERFKEAVQYAVNVGYEAKVSNRFKLHHLVYKEIREKFDIPANFVIEIIAKASENLKSVKLKKCPVIKSAPLTFNRKLFIFSFESIKVATFVSHKRKDVAIDIPEYYWKYLDWRPQTVQLINKKGVLFFHITFSREVNVTNSCRGDRIIGVDLGINNLAVTSDGQVFKGIKTKIIQHRYMQKRLQRKGTKSAKRLLKKRRGRWTRFMRDVNHCVSKAIVNSADVVVIEDLTGIRKKRTKHRKSKRMNGWINNWGFYQLRRFLEYKASFQGKTVVAIDPYMTSQACSHCCKAGSRYLNSFVCPHCGFSADADFNASCNLRRLYVNQPDVGCDDSKATAC